MLNFSAFIAKLVAAKAFPVGLDSAGQKAMFNEALEMVINSGRWNGNQGILNINLNSSGELTLPRDWQTIDGVRVGGVGRDLASPWFSFVTNAIDPGLWTNNVLDQGDGYPTFAQPSGEVTDVITGGVTIGPVPAKLRVTSVGGSGTVEVHGTDADGAEVWTGAQRGSLLTFGNPKAVPYFQTITAVIKPVTTQICYLYACYDDDTEEVIAIYEPGETVPSYRRYFVPEAANLDPDSLGTTTVVALANRRHVDMVADNDIVPIANFGAMKKAVAAVHWDNEGDETRSTIHLNGALKLLNDELKRLRPPTEEGAMRVRAKYCGASGLRSFR